MKSSLILLASSLFALTAMGYEKPHEDPNGGYVAAKQAAQDAGDDFLLTVVSPNVTLYISSTYDTTSLYHFTEVYDDSTSTYEWRYIDPNPTHLTLLNSSTLRYTYANWDSTFYDVLFTNTHVSRDGMQMKLVISGQEMASMAIELLNGQSSADSIDQVLTANGNPLRMAYEMFAPLIPSINVKISKDNTVTINPSPNPSTSE